MSMIKTVKLMTLILSTAAVSACSGYDNEYFPYTMKGLNVYVYDNEANREHFGGFIEASYFAREDAIARCANLAAATASQTHLKEWGYVCCTVTSSSSCETKVR